MGHTSISFSTMRLSPAISAFAFAYKATHGIAQGSNLYSERRLLKDVAFIPGELVIDFLDARFQGCIWTH